MDEKSFASDYVDKLFINASKQIEEENCVPDEAFPSSLEVEAAKLQQTGKIRELGLKWQHYTDTSIINDCNSNRTCDDISSIETQPCSRKLNNGSGCTGTTQTSTDENVTQIDLDVKKPENNSTKLKKGNNSRDIYLKKSPSHINILKEIEKQDLEDIQHPYFGDYYDNMRMEDTFTNGLQAEISTKNIIGDSLRTDKNLDLSNKLNEEIISKISGKVSDEDKGYIEISFPVPILSKSESKAEPTNKIHNELLFKDSSCNPENIKKLGQEACMEKLQKALDENRRKDEMMKMLLRKQLDTQCWANNINVAAQSNNDVKSTHSIQLGSIQEDNKLHSSNSIESNVKDNIKIKNEVKSSNSNQAIIFSDLDIKKIPKLKNSFTSIDKDKWEDEEGYSCYINEITEIEYIQYLLDTIENRLLTEIIQQLFISLDVETNSNKVLAETIKELGISVDCIDYLKELPSKVIKIPVSNNYNLIKNGIDFILDIQKDTLLIRLESEFYLMLSSHLIPYLTQYIPFINEYEIQVIDIPTCESIKKESTSENSFENDWIREFDEDLRLNQKIPTGLPSHDKLYRDTPEEISDVITGIDKPEEVLELKTDTNTISESNTLDKYSDSKIFDESNSNMNIQEDEGWMLVLGHELLKKRVIRAGIDNTRPKQGDLVKIRTAGYIENGIEVEPLHEVTFVLGDGDVINAFDLIISLMDVNEVCEVFTDSKYAYGERGREPDIPGNTSINYEIELLSVISVAQFIENSSAKDIYLQAEQKRMRGNFYYARKDNQNAIHCYTKAIEFLDYLQSGNKESNNDLITLVNNCKIKCYNNMAASQLKIDAFDVAIKSCESVLKEEPNNTKALFRKGKCLAGKGQLKEAIQHLRDCLKIAPESKLIHTELSKFVEEFKEQNRVSKVMYRKMLGNVPVTPVVNIYGLLSFGIAVIAMFASMYYSRMQPI